MFKKTTVAVLGLAASGFAVAGSMGPVCTPGNVTVPCEAKAWDIGVQALYLKPLYSAEKNYLQTGTATYIEQDNDWDWGYRLEGSYHFNTGNDITMNWTHFSNDTQQGPLIGLLVPLAPELAFPYTNINKDRFDQVNLIMGQHVDVGLVKKLRFYGGLQYANIQVNGVNYYTIAPIPEVGITGVRLSDDTDFKGVGPVVGLDYSYNLTDAFSVTANAAGSILSGTSRYNLAYVIAPTNGVLASAYASKKALVPSLEGKLGLNYAHSMAQGTLNIEGGYQVVNYFNALQTQIGHDRGNPFVDSDFGLYGPYLGARYVGNA